MAMIWPPDEPARDYEPNTFDDVKLATWMVQRPASDRDALRDGIAAAVLFALILIVASWMVFA